MSNAQLQSLSAHAKKRLDRKKTAKLNRKEKLELYRRFLKTEEHRILLYHRSGGSGVRVTKRRADLIGILLKHLYMDATDSSEGKSPEVTLAAIGGFGRGNLNPCSDVDLLFLHPKGAKGLPREAAEMIESVLYMLYDCGFKVGHAVRSIKETIIEANSDNRTKSSIIESRMLFGNESLYQSMLNDFYKNCIRGHGVDYLKVRLEDIRLRHIKWSGTPFLQEPHIKEGCGGLRDYHNLIWINYVRRKSTNIKDLVEANMLSPGAYRQIRNAYEFLLRVRNEMHYIQKRSTDILTLQLQGEVAKNLGYKQRGILRKIEAFMRDYYTHSNNLFLQAKEIGDRFYLQQRESESKKPIIGFLARRKFKVEHFDGFVAKNNRIYPKSSKVFQKDPDRLIRIFQHAQVRHLRLAPELSVLIKRNWKLINRSFRYNDANRDTFEAILSRKGDVSTALREMHSSGILGRYLPEFGALTNLVQHEFFHRYSADEHTLRVTEELDKLILESEDQRKSLYREIYQEIEDPFVLYLAVLLHDTGRAMNTSQHEDASATLAQNVARRFSLKTKRRQLLLFLVNSHLELWRTANTKNINDPSTIVKFAQIVGSKRWLNYLMLLTYADSRGTDLRSWTDTKEAPLRFLFLETREYLEDAKAFSKKRKEAKDELLQRVIEQLPQSHKSTAMDHFVEMPARYFLRNEASHIARHVKLLIDYFKDWASTESVQRPILHWREIAQQGCSEFSVIWQDQHKLASCLTGALAAQKVNIISAEFFARGDGVVFDIFRVCSTKFEPITSSNKKKNIEKLLVSGLTEKDFSYDDLIKEADKDLLDWHELANQFPQRVYINNQADENHTLIEIQALDRIGLLHRILSSIAEIELEVTHARITTTRGAAIDTIYVVTSEGNKITNGKILSLLLTNLEKAIEI